MSDTDPDLDPPPYVARHFVAGRGAFYYHQRPDVLAFSIRGPSFRAHDDSVMTATAIVALAQQRGWSSVRVRGSTAFRRVVWAAASERGIRVFGYAPSRGEAAVLAQSASPDGHPSCASKDAYKPAAGRPSDDPLTGVVFDMGPAPYRHERANSESFYVTLRASDGREHTHWGVDLERALKEVGANRRDRVALERRDKPPEEVDRAVRDAVGDVSYRKKEIVARTAWEVRVLGRESVSSHADFRPRASEDPEVAKALTLLERRLPDLPESLRCELHRHFDARPYAGADGARRASVLALAQRIICVAGASWTLNASRGEVVVCPLPARL